MANENVPQPPHRGVSPWIVALFLIPLATIPFLKSVRPGMRETPDQAAAPEIHFKDPDGKPHTLSEFRGTTLLVNFWASWCGPCMEEMPDLIELQKKFPESKFKVLALNLEDRTVSEKFSKGFLPPYTFYDLPEDDIDKYQVDSIPVSFLIDPKGKIRGTFDGPRDWTSREVLQELQEVIDGNPSQN